MLILAKSILGLTLGFIIAIITGFIVIPLIKMLNARQTVSEYINKRHQQKNGTPTIGGLIFIIPVLVSILVLILRGSIEWNHNLVIVLLVFLGYGALGFADDLKKILEHNNKGLSIAVKFIAQLAIAIAFYIIYKQNGGISTLEVSLLGFKWNMGYGYAAFILFLLVGTTNAVNITDGLDGLAGGLSVMAFLAFALISWNASAISGTEDIAILCFVLVGSILGFLVYNTHPAKIFMGDTGSLALGATLASVAIITKHEITFIVVSGVFIFETLVSIIQIISMVAFHRKVFLMTPFHHHLEKLGWDERDIVKLFWVIGLILSMMAITFGVWI